MVYKGYNKTYDFRKFKIIHVFGEEIRNNTTKMYTTNGEQNHLTKYIKESKTKTKPHNNSYLKKSKRGCN